MKSKTGKGNAYTSWSVILAEQAEKQTGALLLGDVNSVNDRTIYKLHRVKTVVQCGKDLEIGENKEAKVHIYPIVDDGKYSIAQHFEEIYQLIREASKEGGVLVHCFSGISRSPAIIIAYLMRAYLIDYDTALKRVKSRRFFIAPNDSFVRQLRNYEKHIKELRELRKKPKQQSEPVKEEKVRYVSKSPMRARGAAIPIMNSMSKQLQKSGQELVSSPKTQKSVTGSSQSLSKYDPDVIKNIYGRTTK